MTSVGALLRADYLFKTAKYEKQLRPAIAELRKVLHLDSRMAGVLTLVALAAAAAETSRKIPGAWLYVLAGGIIFGLLSAPIGPSGGGAKERT